MAIRMGLLGYMQAMNEAMSTSLPEITVTATEVENPNDKTSTKAVDLVFYNSDEKRIGKASISAIDSPIPFLYNLEVFKQYRGKKYSISIMNYIMKTYKPKELTVKPDNKVAINLYKKYGFRKRIDYNDNGIMMDDMVTADFETLAKTIEESSKNISKYNNDKGKELNTPKSTEKLYPVYIVLVSSSSGFGKVIKAATKSMYTHASITLDTSMNNLYSFSHIPLSWMADLGLVRESIWSPEFRNVNYFTVLVTFVNKENRDKIQNQIDYFIANHDKFNYNFPGIVGKLFNVHNTTDKDAKKKRLWYCSEFVSMVANAGGIKGYDDIALAPGEMIKPNVFVIGDYTGKTYNEKEVKEATKRYEAKFRENSIMVIPKNESVLNSENIKNESVISEVVSTKRVTALVDWKKIHDEYCRMFPNNNPDERFDLLELIAVDMASKGKLPTDMTEALIYEMKRVSDAVEKSKITLVDKMRKFVKFIINNTKKVLEYPSLKFVELMGETSLVATPDRGFKKVKAIVDNLSKEDLNHFTNGEFKDSDRIVYRNILSEPGGGKGFIDVYKLTTNDSNDTSHGFIVVAVEKSARGKGLGEKLVADAIANCPAEINSFTWRCDKDNISSIKLAEKCGFTKYHESKNQITYILERDKLNEYAQTNQISSREERDRQLKKYGLRQVGYGQRTREEDEERIWRSHNDELKRSNKENKKIYREDADDTEELPDSYGYEFEWHDEKNTPQLTTDNLIDSDSDLMDEASDSIDIDTKNPNMIKTAEDNGYQFIHKTDDRIQKMYKFDYGDFNPDKLNVTISIFFNKGEPECTSIYQNPEHMNTIWFKDPLTEEMMDEASLTSGINDKCDSYVSYNASLSRVQLLRLSKKFKYIKSKKDTFSYTLHNETYEEHCKSIIESLTNSNDIKVKYINKGKLKDYDQKVIDTISSAINKKQQKINEAISFPLIAPFVSSFVIRIDNKGNINITQKEYDDFDRHVQNSLRLLKIYRDSDNIEGMKTELCRLYYMADLIDKYYLHGVKHNKKFYKKMLNLRSVILNAVSGYLKFIISKEPKFDFTKYYNQSKYGKDIKITHKHIELLGNVVKTLL